MTPAEICEALRKRFPDRVLEAVADAKMPFVRVDPAAIVDVCTFARDDGALRFDLCHSITAVDRPKENLLTAVYHLLSVTHGHWIAIKADLPRDKPEIATVTGLWPAADWHERECWDLLGVRFTGRATLRRVLLPEDWEGHPLRKDYEYPTEYHGVPCWYPDAHPLADVVQKETGRPL